MNKEKLVPKLRFEEFGNSEEWVKVELEDFLTKSVDNRGKTPPTSNEGDHPLIEVASIGKMTPDYSKVNKFLNEEIFKTRLRGYLKEDDILFSTVGSIGAVSLMDANRKAAIAQNIVGFRAKEKYMPEYLYSMLTSNYNQMRSNRIAMGAVQPSIKVSQLVKVKYPLSNIREEQEKIGLFFKRIDQMIQLQQSKVNKLKAIKSAYLSEMFPKEREKYPKKRFEGFTEPWIEYSLERIGDIVGGNSWKSNEYDKEGSHLIITIANVSGDYSVDINEGNKITPNNNRYVLSEGDILISMTGNVGRVSRMPEVKAVLNQRVGKLVINSGIDKEFIFTILQNKKFERSMILQGQGAAQLNISRTDILDYRFKIPEYNEQKKIGQLFKNINDQISVEEEKLMKLEKLKQAYLNDMFV